MIGKTVGSHPPHVVSSASRQIRQDLGDRGIDQQCARDHVAAPTEVDGDLRRATRAAGAYVLHAGYRADRLLNRPCYQQRHLVSRTAAGIEVDDHARERHLREKPDRQRPRGDCTGDRDGDRHEQDRTGVTLDEASEGHGALLDRTVAWSESW
jgi:hypothetical protein